jgi:hypothetical protein
LGPLLDKNGDVKLVFSSPDEVVVKHYASQAYSEKPHPENGVVARRDVLAHTTVSGRAYTLRGVVSYDKGKPYTMLVEAHAKDAHPFESDSITRPADERITLLSREFQEEYARYQHGQTGARTFGEYAKPGRELVQHIRILGELEGRGLTDEARVAAQQIAEDIRRLESGGVVAKGEGEGRGFFDYSAFPQRVQQELAHEAPSVDELKEVVSTRGGIVLRQLGRDINAEIQAIMAGPDKK